MAKKSVPGDSLRSASTAVATTSMVHALGWLGCVIGTDHLCQAREGQWGGVQGRIAVPNLTPDKFLVQCEPGCSNSIVFTGMTHIF